MNPWTFLAVVAIAIIVFGSNDYHGGGFTPRYA